MTNKIIRLYQKLLSKLEKAKLITLFSACALLIAAIIVLFTVGANKPAKSAANENSYNSAMYKTSSTDIAKNESSSMPTSSQPTKVTSVKLNKTSVKIKVGAKITLTAEVLPKNAEDKTVLWKTDDKTIATVSKGSVKALKKGTCNITAEVKDGVKAKCKLTVTGEAKAKTTVNNKTSSAVSSSKNTKTTTKTTTKSTTKTPTKFTKKTTTVSKPGFKNSAFKTSSQVIAVVANTMHTRYATVRVYQKSSDSWCTVMSGISALIGKNGMVYDSLRKQGTDTTPAGIYNIMFAFGWAKNPGTKITYRVADKKSYWNENSGSSTYNRWVEGCPGGEFEQLATEPLYKHALVLNFNWNQTPKKGAGIFIHDKPNYYTGGCVGIDDSSLVKIMKWLNPNANAKVLICPKSDFSKYYY